MSWTRYIPLIEQLRSYGKPSFRSDLVAGLTVAIMLVPQGMAYALLAGMPPIYGLYAGLVPPLVYGLLGTSRQLSLGPVAISSLLVLAGISQLAEPESDRYIELVILTGFLVGAAKLLLSALRLGFLVRFLSHPVIAGFTSAAAVIIAVNQLKYLLGIEIPRFTYSYETVYYAIQHLSEIHWLSFVCCVGSIMLMWALRRWAPQVPGALVVTILGVGITAYFRLDQLGLNIVGQVPKGLPAFSVPVLEAASIRVVLPTVFAVTIISIVESIGIAKTLELKNKDTKVLPNQELLALGAAKVAGSFFQSLPSSASFTRSAINNQAGARTGVASIVAASAIGFTLIFFTPLFYYLPKATLAAIILTAVRGLFEWERARYLWRVHRKDFLMLSITFVITLAFGIEEGVLAGVVLSLLTIIYQTSRPHVVVLGQLADGHTFRNIERFPEATQFTGILIMRFDAPLFFMNADYFKDKVIDTIRRHPDRIEVFILDASSILDIDSSGLEALEEIHRYLSERGTTFYLSGVLGPVRDRLQLAGLLQRIGLHNHFLYIRDALDYHQREGEQGWSPQAVQFNRKRKHQ
ncbi:MAG: solute carrier 26 family protein [Bacteroidetes bacterium]|nr:MAG: solute carrier 26 family protein [Bacteroidota bacterium]